MCGDGGGAAATASLAPLPVASRCAFPVCSPAECSPGSRVVCGLLGLCDVQAFVFFRPQWTQDADIVRAGDRAVWA
jgi:hypothetical protein